MEEVIAILYAMSAEASLIRSRLAPLTQIFTEGQITAWSGRMGKRKVILMQTGIGSKQAVRAVTLLAEWFDVKALFSIGYAGAVDPSLKAGDLLLPGAVVRLEGLEEKETFEADAWLHSIALSISGLGRDAAGRIATTDRFIPETERKREIFEKTRASAIEMESSAIAAAASKAGIPVAFVRAISDEADFDLTRWHDYLLTARSGGRGAHDIAGKSSELRAVTEAFNRRAQLASHSLAAFAGKLFDSLAGPQHAGGPVERGRLQ
jgi:adenosylhomocysteine nucleosidase